MNKLFKFKSIENKGFSNTANIFSLSQSSSMVEKLVGLTRTICQKLYLLIK